MQRPSERFIGHSQNFLRSGALVDRLIDSSSIRSGELVLDLGAGTGLISRRLASHGCRVVAVEKDPFLATRLRRQFASLYSVQVRQCDILDLDLPRKKYKVFSNIPFHSTAEIVNRLTGAVCPPDDTHLVVQLEAAERVLGQPRTTLASVLLYPWFEASTVHRFRRSDFVPSPHVEAVMLRLRKRGPPLIESARAQRFRDFVVALFTAPSPSVGDTLSRMVGSRRGLRLARALDLADAPPTHVALPRWLDLFDLTDSLLGEELGWRVAHAERRLRSLQHKLRKCHRTRSRPVRPPPADEPVALQWREAGGRV